MGKNGETLGSGHLITYKDESDAFKNTSTGKMTISGSTLNFKDQALIYGDDINVKDSTFNIRGNNYILSHSDDIQLNNSQLTISDDKILTILSGKDINGQSEEEDIDDYDTILIGYQALNPTFGGLNMKNNSVLNVAGTLYADAKIDNGTVNINSRNATIHGTTSLSNGSVLNLGANKLTTDILNINSGSTVNFTVASKDNYGSVKSNNATISSDNTTLNLTLNSGVVDYDDATGITIKMIDADNLSGSFGTLNETNNRYGFEDLGNGNYHIYGLGNSAKSLVANAGGKADTQEAATAWLDTQHSESNVGIANYLENLAQVSAPALTKAIETLQPEDSSVRVETTTSNNLQIANVTTTRLNSLAATEAIGRAGGDTYLQSNIWAQGLYNKAKFDTSKGFSSKTHGVAMGFDAKPTDNTIVGIGYAYTETDLDAQQKATDIESHTAMLYGQQTIGDTFVNAIVTYGFNQYDENRSGSGVSDSSKYDMDSVFSQVMTGYNFNLDTLKITPKAGLRYLWTHIRDYTDSANQHVKSENTNTVTGVIGTTVSSDFKVQGLTLTPKFTLAGTYDVKQDGGNSTVTLSNGASYTTHGDTLKRFGVETGIGLNMSYKDLEFGIQYEGRFKKDYKDHTGLINLRYHF